MNNSAPRRAFSLIELLIVIAILAVLAAILFPVLSRAREQGNRAACLSNIRQLGMALTMYVQDNDGYFPPDRSDSKGSNYKPAEWRQELTAFVKGKAHQCPSCPIPAIERDSPGDILNRGYALNAELFGARLSSLSETTVSFPSTTVAFCESAYQEKREYQKDSDGEGWTTSTDYVFMTTGPEDGSGLEPGYSYVGLPGGVRHDGGSNYVFVDGHARWHKPEQVKNSENPNDGKTPSFAL